MQEARSLEHPGGSHSSRQNLMQLILLPFPSFTFMNLVPLTKPEFVFVFYVCVYMFVFMKGHLNA